MAQAVLEKEEPSWGMAQPSPILTTSGPLQKPKFPYSQAVLEDPWHPGNRVALEDPAKEGRHDDIPAPPPNTSLLGAQGGAQPEYLELPSSRCPPTPGQLLTTLGHFPSPAFPRQQAPDSPEPWEQSRRHDLEWDGEGQVHRKKWDGEDQVHRKGL